MKKLVNFGQSTSKPKNRKLVRTLKAFASKSNKNFIVEQEEDRHPHIIKNAALTSNNWLSHGSKISDSIKIGDWTESSSWQYFSNLKTRCFEFRAPC